MEANKNMLNIGKYLTDRLNEAIQENFKDFIPPTFKTKVIWNVLDSSDLTTPVPMQIYNMCNKKPNFGYESAEKVGEKLISTIKDPNGIIGEMKVTVQTPPQKDNKKKKEESKKEEEKKEEKKKKEKKIPVNTYIDFFIKSEWIENECNSIITQGFKLDTSYTGHRVLVDFSSPNIGKIYF
ncbi:MAG: hypothetical protein MJ252_24515 [archaeon]|nr:hypothetical protein [archaeon]